MSSVNIEAAKIEEVKTRVPTVRVLKILTIISALLLVLITAALVAVVLVFYLPHKCVDNEACKTSDYVACGCGQRKVRPFHHRIVGGVSTRDGEWPFIASLQYNGHHECGATLISCRWILSAAHCFKNTTDTDNWTAAFGVHFLDQSTNSVQKRTIAKKIIHPLATSSYDYDVVLLELSQPVEYTDFVQPACLPAVNASISGRRCTIIGWGKTKEYGSTNNELLGTEVDVYDNSQCQRYLPNITEQIICARAPEGGRDACQGDSGGPLLCQNEDFGVWMVAGIVSAGFGCGTNDYPGIYIRSAASRDWIMERMNA
ncbi:transmembrane protease serine 9-like [Pristis pectinata]|uniref:transmembrane protease serine 9-like n=1 Tax=Pristis pectinata TaxID=685728 RepID=UPI00223CC70E|nr:transmembrane protease serine 9-like [Pristis pectinata]